MSIQEYVQVVLKRWWVILLVTASAAVAAYGFSKLQTPLYRSQATYTVLFNRLDTGAQSFADTLLNTYVSLVRQPDELQGISDELGLDQSGDFLMEYVRLQGQADSTNIVIQADYFDPASAQALAAAVGERLNARVVEANRNLEGEDRAYLQRVQKAKAAGLAKPKTRTNVIAAVLLGGVIGVLLSFVLEYLDDTLKTAGDVERFAGLVTIGAIPALGRAPTRGGGRTRPAVASGLVSGGGRQRPPRNGKEPS